MFKKLMARLGKGAATVDLRFENRPYQAGEIIEGEVHILGGEVKQKMNSLSVRLMMEVFTKQGLSRGQVATIPLTGSYRIMPKEQTVIPFTYQIPEHLPVTRSSVSYFFDTLLDIEGGVDRTDFDRIIISAPKQIEMIFQALGKLGFREKPTSGRIDRYGQEFSFFPTQAYAGFINELELRFAHDVGGVTVFMEVDIRNGFQEIEAKREFTLNDADFDDETDLAELINQYIKEIIDNPYGYSQPFSYTSYHGHHGHHHQKHSHHSGIGSMVGGMAAGILGGVLLSEAMDEMMEATGIEEIMEEAGFDIEDSGDEGGFDFGFCDFFGGDDE